MITLETVKQLLQAEGIPYIIQKPGQDEHWASLILRIEGGCREAPLRIIFGQANGEYNLFDLRFGRFDYELFEYDDDHVLDVLVENIHAVMNGETHIIYAWNTKNGHWRAEACYCIAPGTEDDDSEEYQAALRRIERPRHWLTRLLTRRVTYAVYNWHSYREITR